MNELAIENNTKPRAVLLYRASSKKQTDSENDIPLQRNILKPWAERQGYEYVREFCEGGVSGFKVSAAKRDAIIEIKAMAERREFDILGIYMSDRLGRIAEETPLIVSFLNARGIKVISYTEGEITAYTHTDKLLTYIRFWQAEGESLKTAARCQDAIEQMVRQGKWRGGCPPYGYVSVSRGTQNFKGKPIFDVEINPETAEIVKTVFRLYTKEHYGTKLIAKYLNDKGVPTAKGKLWNSSVISNMLNCRTYTGIYILHSLVDKPEIESPFMPDFKIIEQEEWDAAQRLLAANNKYPTGQKPTRHGKLLLTGLAYCGQCGEKLTSHYTRLAKSKCKPNEELKKFFLYRCRRHSTPQSDRPQCKPSMWGADKLERAVIKYAKEYLLTIDREKLLNLYESQMKERLAEATERYKKTVKEAAQLEKEAAKIKDEILKALLGASSVSLDILNAMHKTKEEELAEITKRQEAAKTELEKVEAEVAYKRAVADEIDNWAERFDRQTNDNKKAMLISIIDRVTVYGDRVEVDFKIKLDPQMQFASITEIEANAGLTAEAGDNSALYDVKGYKQPTESLHLVSL
jgi:DNA invertase Pin-like site-specific DNA recombinase